MATNGKSLVIRHIAAWQGVVLGYSKQGRSNTSRSRRVMIFFTRCRAQNTAASACPPAPYHKCRVKNF